MTNFKKTLLGVAAAMALAAPAANAALINVGGVVWDPDSPTGGADRDFTARFEFTQWFTTAANAVADTDGAIPNLLSIINPAAVAVGDVLQGVGEINKVNGTSYGDLASTTGGGPGSFCPSCELTFSFGGFAVSTISPETLSNGWFRVYVDDTPDYDGAANPLDTAAAVNGQLWLELVVGANSFTTAGGFGSGFLTTFASAVDGLAKNNFDTNSFGIFDTRQSASALFDLTDIDGDGLADDWISTSTGEIKADSIPEPTSLALVGIGLLGLGGMSASRKRAKA
jgi:hypothetical protein